MQIRLQQTFATSAVYERQNALQFIVSGDYPRKSVQKERVKALSITLTVLTYITHVLTVWCGTKAHNIQALEGKDGQYHGVEDY